MRSLLLASTLLIASCTGAALPPTPQDSGAPIWNYATWAPELRALSCPDEVSFVSPPDLDIRVIPAERGTENARETQLTGLALSGAWQLESDNSEFGGLSGLDELPSGDLLAVTDDGKFVWIGIDADARVPNGTGAMEFMRDRQGKIYPNKRSADAEDLVVRDGLAFVSFEQEHRIFAYNLATCGAAARAAMVVKLNKVVDQRVLENNRGAESLSFSGDTLKVGFEARSKGGSPVGTVRVDGGLADLERTKQPFEYLLTAMDAAENLTASVFRAYDPIRGSRGIIKITRAGEEVASARLRSPLPVDNFESVAIGTSPEGGTRIWLISDDNFSNDQRTLLLALDLTD